MHETGPDEFDRAGRFARGRFPPRRYACPSCSAHAATRGLCLVCCGAVTEPLPRERRTVGTVADAPARLEELRAEARYHRQRYDLYRAKAYGMRPVNPVRLRELEHAAVAAEERLAHALDASR
ncbi:MAG: hypothetical protein JWM71_2209 [Solirubrobacteraceae bacterium]|nr:hypothetical protein [Solirubrobacteraceae bacterium]